MVLVLVLVGVELGAIRGVVAILAYHNVFGLSAFATNLLTLFAIAASTDYAIFMLGRYHEARYAGETPAPSARWLRSIGYRRTNRMSPGRGNGPRRA
ncbi:hypothetical protein BRW65_21105 [Mycobacterium paraffinicum]|uniref:Membrane transport protein MMPL domain-containing protein n=1 Tax=Mycobacterium paraffinicum TaxID=53378 RepID=A0A1Q4HQ17_9MYCO|nr:MMPL family transporter [Mycobacterium paraffinicum]OJZ70033.1 hypothetical protein BRW65_21105 [Mycobacterium paraffinicum]